MEHEEICEVDGCGFPTSECMIPEHPKLCGEHLEKWFLNRCKRIELEQMYQHDHPDPVGV